MVYNVRDMTAKKSHKNEPYGSFEYFLFLFVLVSYLSSFTRTLVAKELTKRKECRQKKDYFVLVELYM